jgi:glutathione synthase/RimK-type ligase-like ATP-grasp enzyme
MIYIISQQFDTITDAVIDRLVLNHNAYKRINMYAKQTHEIPFAFDLTKDQHFVEDILWIRKLRNEKSNAFQRHIQNESLKGLYELANVRFKKVIGNFNQIYSHNKVKILKAAQDTGILIPPTIVTISKNNLLAFIEEHGEVITKCCADMAGLHIDGKRYYQYTSIVDKKTISTIPDSFCVSLFQKHIKKAFDVKIFYFNGFFFGQAIFSQQNVQTSIDFRKYDDTRPNRVCPFRLPENIEKKLHQLMVNQEEIMGTIDLIMSIDNKLYFLEINPNGEFFTLSHQCNYSIDKVIADYLIQEDSK